MRNWLIGLLLCLITSAAATEQPDISSAEVAQFFDDIIQLDADKNDWSHLGIAVVYNGQLTLTKGYGFADKTTRLKFDPTRHLIRPGSVAKLLTWTAVMQLAEQGRIDLDADVNTYLDFTIPTHPSGPVTMRHLMTHRAGFEDVLRDLMTTSPDQLVKNEAWLKRWVPQRVFDAGAVPAYSNYAAALAGYIVERVSQMPFEQYIEQHIFQPAGMNHSSFRQPVPAQFVNQLGKIYDQSGTTPVPYDYISPTPAGALTATAHDMGLFMAAFLAADQTGSATLLNATSRDQMLNYSTPHAQGMKSMALGFIRSNEQGLQILEHSGNTRTYHSHLLLVPEYAAGLFISVGYTGNRAKAYQIREKLTSAFIARYLPNKANAALAHNDPAGAQQRAAQVAGYYQSSRASFSTLLTVLQPLNRLKVTATASGDLMLAGYLRPDNTPWLWREVQPYVWQQVDGQDRLSAQVTSGQPVLLNIGFVAAVQSWYQVHPLANAAVLVPAWCIALLVLLLALLKLPYGYFRNHKRWLQQPNAVLSMALAGCILALFAGLVLLNLALERMYSFAPSDALSRSAQLLCFMAVIGLIPAALLFKQSFALAGQWLQRILYLLTVLALLFVTAYFVVYQLWSVQLYY